MKSATREETAMKAIAITSYVKLVVILAVAAGVLVFAATASASRSI
jgi:hypothetical protein